MLDKNTTNRAPAPQSMIWWDKPCDTELCKHHCQQDTLDTLGFGGTEVGQGTQESTRKSLLETQGHAPAWSSSPHASVPWGRGGMRDPQ